MAKEYIEKEAAVLFLRESAEGLHDTPSWASLLEECADKIADFPAANVRENVKAHWIEDRTEYVCSACGQRVSDEIFYMLRPNMMLPGFCPNPNCGAEMGGNDG